MALILLLLSLITVALLFISYFFTREEPLPSSEKVEKGKIQPPQFLFVITGGPGELQLKKPLDVKISPKNGRVYVTTRYQKYGKGRVEVFTPDGAYLYSFEDIGGGQTLRNPVYLAINAQGNVYVSDTRLKNVYIFSPEGKFIKKFVPNGDPDFEWNPLALTFDKKGYLYASNTYMDHEIVVFDANGKLKFRFGKRRYTLAKGQYKGDFYFPNGIVVDRDGRMFIADSNNRRVQVFSPQGKLIYIVESGGNPRGIAVDSHNRLYAVDALGHDVSVIRKTDRKGVAICIFGEQGVDFGQFQYPNGMGLDKAERRIYVTDRENDRVQVWGWPITGGVSVPVRRGIAAGALAIPPIMLLLWLFMRRRRIYACNEFMEQIIDNQQLIQLSNKVRKVFVAPETYESLKGYVEGDLEIADVMRPIKIDETSIKSMEENQGLNHELATIFARARKGWKKPRILSEQDDTHIVAQKLGIESMDHELFVEQYSIKEEKRGKGTMKSKTKKPKKK